LSRRQLFDFKREIRLTSHWLGKIGNFVSSFQMSFAATLGLVAMVQIGMPRLFASPDNSTTAKVALWGGRER